MIKQKITYATLFDPDTELETEEYFHLSESDLIDLEVHFKPSMTKYLERIVEERDSEQIMRFFKTIIEKSYGVKVDDNFFKSDDHLALFKASGKFNALFVKLLSDVDEATDFLIGILPVKAQSKAVELITDSKR